MGTDPMTNQGRKDSLTALLEKYAKRVWEDAEKVSSVTPTAGTLEKKEIGEKVPVTVQWDRSFLRASFRVDTMPERGETALWDSVRETRDYLAENGIKPKKYSVSLEEKCAISFCARIEFEY